MSDLFWKPAAIVLLLALLVVGGWTGAGWWLAARDRDAARAELVAERKVSEELRASIREQNRAVEALGQAKAQAEQRGEQAARLAAANGRRFDDALGRIANAKATTCAEAMPAVDAVLEAIQ